MASFATDADIPLGLAHLLQASGHDVVTAHQLRLTGASDDVHLLTAAEQGRALITHNEKDFLLLQRAWLRWSVAWGVQPRPQHAGILVLPQIPATQYAWLVQAIERLIASRPSLANELHAWRHTYWQQLP